MNFGVLSAIIGELKQRGIGYVVTDLDLKITSVCGDPQLFPECDASAIGLPLTDVALELIGNEGALTSILNRAAERLQFDFINRDLEDGRSIYLRITDFPYHDENGDVAGLVHLLEDVTTTTVEQQRVLQQRNELAILQRLQSQTTADLTSTKNELGQINAFNRSFLAVAAHSLSEPLTAVGGFVELLQERTNSSVERHAATFGILTEAVDKLYRVTDTLLDILRIEAKQILTSSRSSNLTELVREAMDDLKSELKRKDVEVVLQVGENLPDVFCDEEQTVRLIRRLLQISVECVPEHGELTILLKEDVERSQVDLVVQCCDSDIIAELLENLSSKSKQQDRVLPEMEQGNPLELYVVFALLKLQNGDIYIKDVGQGCRDLVASLPVAASD